MDPLRRFFGSFVTWYVVGYLVLVAGIAFLFWQNSTAREERTLELCFTSISDSEKLILVAAQDPEPDDPTDERLLRVFRNLTKQGLPEICRPRYEEMREKAVKQLERLLVEALRAG